jgi:hypothetical protein
MVRDAYHRFNAEPPIRGQSTCPPQNVRTTDLEQGRFEFRACLGGRGTNSPVLCLGSLGLVPTGIRASRDITCQTSMFLSFPPVAIGA